MPFRVVPVVAALRTFARAERLPAPAVIDDGDGQHVFVYSRDRTRRYAYALTWDARRAAVLWIMLNPGTGETEGRRRRTFERCKAWSRAMGAGGLLFGNVVPVRAKSAKQLVALFPSLRRDALNERALTLLGTIASQTIVAWGGHGGKTEQASALAAALTKPLCFGVTRAGHPRHPLYVRGDTALVRWTPVSRSRAHAA